MPIAGSWWVFSDVLIDSEQDIPGVYELGNAAGEVIYIGSSPAIRRRLREHWSEPTNSLVKRHTTQYRVEYREDYLARERNLYGWHLRTHRRPPICRKGQARRRCGFSLVAGDELANSR
jgi:predicted GIY-YIG superfamily endonuclease